MAFKKETTYSARPKRTSDGAVSARYKKKKQEDAQEEKILDKLTAPKTKRAQEGAAGKDAAKKPAPRRTAAQTEDKKPTARRQTAEKTEKPEKTEKKAEKKTAKPAAHTEKKAPVRRAVMATQKEADRAKARKEREPGRIRREKKRIEAEMRDRRRAVSRGVDMGVTMIALLTALFLAGGLLLAAMETPGTTDMQAIYLLGLMEAMCLLTTLALPRMLPIDPLIMALTNFLCGVGVVILYTVSPERGIKQATYYVIGLAAMLIVSLIVSRAKRLKGLTVLSMLAGIVLLVLPLAFGQWSGGAKNWVSIPVFGSFQPSEMVKLSLVLAMAYYFSAHRTVLQMMPAILFAGACLLLLMLQRDLGTALIYYMTTLTMFYVACGNVPLTMIGLAGGAGAAVAGYKMFAHVKVRVAMWRNPWSDPLDKGYQIIQALLAIGSGGLFGVGLGQGTPEKIPAYFNDFIFAVICEQLGIVFGIVLLLVYVIIVMRGVTVISRSRRSFDMLLGCGVLAMLAIQTAMIVGGVIKMLPLTGVTMPFISYGGSSLLSCMCMVGILHGICARAQEDLEEDVLSIKG
ncbi:MAG: FtsW/RodA/SpoVE family cell cycle protein [Clostridia bacterium]|nr:FtsW/RodA/SpoVE family cell cycle protein [Clostridia bacterium]